MDISYLYHGNFSLISNNDWNISALYIIILICVARMRVKWILLMSTYPRVYFSCMHYAQDWISFLWDVGPNECMHYVRSLPVTTLTNVFIFDQSNNNDGASTSDRFKKITIFFTVNSVNIDLRFLIRLIFGCFKAWWRWTEEKKNITQSNGYNTILASI